MLPLLGAMIGAGGTIAGGLIGAEAEHDSMMMNYNLALLNYYQRERERRQQMQQADKVSREQKLGATDAAGNRTYFKEGVGWVTDLSDDSQYMQDLQQREQRAVLEEDLPMRRQQMRTNNQRQQTEGAQANALLDRFKRQLVNSESPQALESLIFNAKSRGINDAADNAQDTAMRGAIRSGNSNISQIAAAMARQRTEQLGEAASDSRLSAYDLADNIKSKRLSDTGNLYNMFATRASAMPGVSYQPQNIDGASTSLMERFAQLGQQGNEMAFNAAGKQGGVMPTDWKPLYGLANTVVNGGAALQAAFGAVDPDRLKKDEYY